MAGNGMRLGQPVKIGSLFGPQWLLNMMKASIKNGTLTRKEAAGVMKDYRNMRKKP